MGGKSGFNGLATVGQIGLVIAGHGGQVDWLHLWLAAVCTAEMTSMIHGSSALYSVF